MTRRFRSATFEDPDGYRVVFQRAAWPLNAAPIGLQEVRLQDPVDPSNSGSAAVVDAQLSAYNSRDIEAFMRCWSEDAQCVAFPHTLIAAGSAAIRAHHVKRFQDEALKARLANRTVLDDLVIDREVVTRTFAGGPGEIEVMAIYHVQQGLIRRAWFKQGRAPGE